jgi:hypothetical protein
VSGPLTARWEWDAGSCACELYMLGEYVRVGSIFYCSLMKLFDSRKIIDKA